MFYLHTTHFDTIVLIRHRNKYWLRILIWLYLKIDKQAFIDNYWLLTSAFFTEYTILTRFELYQKRCGSSRLIISIYVGRNWLVAIVYVHMKTSSWHWTWQVGRGCVLQAAALKAALPHSIVWARIDLSSGARRALRKLAPCPSLFPTSNLPLPQGRSGVQNSHD